ncbi:MAG: type II toxin-antitoxin system death-on-curing family toxin [Armatimonadota bacterium]|nr:type II toxin-antitoxin system death-on-curing family toxin [Armatimonadota bacterium]
MKQPVFLGIDEILEIHRDQIAKYGGSPGIRDVAMLLSAAAMPAATFDGRHLHEDLFEMAAAYLFHITQNHPFLDGNKRTGIVAALVFMALNNIEINVGEDELESMVMAVAQGQADKAAAAEFFRGHIGK